VAISFGVVTRVTVKPPMDSLCTEENEVANRCCVGVGDRKYLGYA
jgi:hypothetical protein